MELSLSAKMVDVEISEMVGKGERLRIAELRAAMPTRTDLDAALIELQRADRIVLYQIDDPCDRSERDENAAVVLGGGFKRHCLYRV